jgi:hypothetical protein
MIDLNKPITAIVTGATYYRSTVTYMLTVYRDHHDTTAGFGSDLLKVITGPDVDWDWGDKVQVTLSESVMPAGQRPVYHLVEGRAI